MIARALRPDDVIVWPDSGEQFWVTASHPVDPDNVLDGDWRLITERLVGIPAGDRYIRAENVRPDDEFLLVGWDEE